MENTSGEERTSQDQEKNEMESQNPIQKIGEEECDFRAQETDKEKNDTHRQDIDDGEWENHNRGKNCNTYSEKVAVKCFLSILDVLYKLAGIFAVVGVFIAWQSLHTALYPQDIEGNQNYVDMANAGDTYSQMFLAEHYFEIGEYGDAIYWYKLATINKGIYQ
ncbi:MAG: hypothetical protein J1E06_01285, partial [Acutalibacter sp.]|nr:hypothetical protein [Acutalibacter sp.]